ncbi:hypothetical protein C8J98_102232 [Luteibacter sp. OK325]|uniref:c-type cytochrome n=1 Tax=Luteibacter sp. OK325 TaxID=2135670 RepID=UPI000D354580|nr:hypothetical protein [Luteibacter sp. OK325]PTR34044.1 hypothetical protein C8J98_102232 [Luteibacter sp. OK325]
MITIGAPRLAGMNPDYLAHALSMFKDGTRLSVVMQPVAQRLSDDDMHALATYFSAQRPPLAPAPHAPSANTISAGKRLAESGVASRMDDAQIEASAAYFSVTKP